MNKFLCVLGISVLLAAPAAAQPLTPGPVAIEKDGVTLITRSGRIELCGAKRVRGDDFIYEIEGAVYCPNGSPPTGRSSAYEQYSGVTASTIRSVTLRSSPIMGIATINGVTTVGQSESGALVIYGSVDSVSLQSGDQLLSRINSRVRRGLATCMSYLGAKENVACLRRELAGTGYSVRAL